MDLCRLQTESPIENLLLGNRKRRVQEKVKDYPAKVFIEMRQVLLAEQDKSIKLSCIYDLSDLHVLDPKMAKHTTARELLLDGSRSSRAFDNFN